MHAVVGPLVTCVCVCVCVFVCVCVWFGLQLNGAWPSWVQVLVPLCCGIVPIALSGGLLVHNVSVGRRAMPTGEQDDDPALLDNPLYRGSSELVSLNKSAWREDASWAAMPGVEYAIESADGAAPTAGSPASSATPHDTKPALPGRNSLATARRQNRRPSRRASSRGGGQVRGRGRGRGRGVGRVSGRARRSHRASLRGGPRTMFR